MVHALCTSAHTLWTTCSRRVYIHDRQVPVYSPAHRSLPYTRCITDDSLRPFDASISELHANSASYQYILQSEAMAAYYK